MFVRSAYRLGRCFIGCRLRRRGQGGFRPFAFFLHRSLGEQFEGLGGHARCHRDAVVVIFHAVNAVRRYRDQGGKLAREAR